MELTLGNHLPEGMQRTTFLADNADAVVEKNYMKRFSAQRMEELKTELAETDIQIADINAEKKAFVCAIKNQLNPLELSKTMLLQYIKTQSEYVTETCYKYVDTNTAFFYNAEGDMIDHRPLNPEELQKTIFSTTRTGTNN